MLPTSSVARRAAKRIVIDPGRDVTPYLEAAKAEGLRIVGAAETHIHADFVSGSRELADRVGAKLYLSDTGPNDWKYEFANRYDSLLLRDGDEFYVGKVKLEVLHTPGHTPESISFVLTDVGGGANVPMGIFTGDFVFVGSIGRPDLLETAAGVVGSAEVGRGNSTTRCSAFANCRITCRCGPRTAPAARAARAWAPFRPAPWAMKSSSIPPCSSTTSRSSWTTS